MSTRESARPDPRDQGSDDVAARLGDELQRATEEVAKTQAEYDGLLADPGVIQEDRDATALLLENAHRQLESAQSAIAHLEAGEYGRCETCGGDIGTERLAALVDVTTCMNCAD